MVMELQIESIMLDILNDVKRGKLNCFICEKHCDYENLKFCITNLFYNNPKYNKYTPAFVTIQVTINYCEMDNNCILLDKNTKYLEHCMKCLIKDLKYNNAQCSIDKTRDGKNNRVKIIVKYYEK